MQGPQRRQLECLTCWGSPALHVLQAARGARTCGILVGGGGQAQLPLERGAPGGVSRTTLGAAKAVEVRMDGAFCLHLRRQADALAAMKIDVRDPYPTSAFPQS